jgi:hypothetical protein
MASLPLAKIQCVARVVPDDALARAPGSVVNVLLEPHALARQGIGDGCNVGRLKTEVKC